MTYRDEQGRVWEPEIRNPGIMDFIIPAAILIFVMMLYVLAYEAGVTVFPEA